MESELAKQNLVIQRVMDAPVERVWEFWIDPEKVRQWWGPDGFTSPMVKIDFREGGTSLLCMSSPQLGDFYDTWTYTEIAPLKRFEYIDNLSDEQGNPIDPASVGMPPDFPRGMRVLVTFKAVGESKTEVTVTEYDWIPGQMMELSRMGMQQCLEKMAASLNLP